MYFLENKLIQAFIETLIDIKTSEAPLIVKQSEFKNNIDRYSNRCLVCNCDQSWKEEIKSRHCKVNSENNVDNLNNSLKTIKDLQIHANKLGFGSYSKFLEICDTNSIISDINNQNKTSTKYNSNKKNNTNNACNGQVKNNLISKKNIINIKKSYNKNTFLSLPNLSCNVDNTFNNNLINVNNKR